MKASKSVAWVGVCACLSAGCLGTEIGNPQDEEVVLRVTPAAEEAPGVGALLGAGGVEIEDVTWAFSSVEFVGACGAPGASAGVGGGALGRVVDLVAQGVRVASDLDFGAPAGAYCEVRVRVDALDDALEARPSMDGLSMRVSGVREDGVPFVLEEERPLQISASGQGASVRLRQAERSMLFLVVDVAPLFGEGVLDGLEPGEDGVLRIGRGSHPQALARVRSNLKASLRFGQDLDADGRPSAEELEDFSVGVDE
jgi:hypothetical protein